MKAGADSTFTADYMELNGTVDVGTSNKLTIAPYTDGQNVAVDTTSWFDPDPSDDIEWTNRVRVTVDGDKVDGTGDDGDLTNFPVYVDLSQMPAGFFEEVQSDGGDIRVVPKEGSDAGTAVPRELVGGSVNKEGKEGELHFRATSLSAGQEKTFYMYYGAIDTTTGEDPATPLTPRTTPTDVWMNGFDMVQHMDNPGDLMDSTANNRDETSRTGGGLRAGPEKVNGTVEFDGEDDFVTTSADYNNPSELTISTWLNFDDMPSGCCENIASSGAWAQFRTLVQPSNDINRIEWRADADPPHSTIDLSRLEPDKWFHVTARFNGNETTHSTLLNGVLADQDQSEGSTLGTATEQSIAGDPNNMSRVFDGRLDEMRISKVARSDGWLKTQVNNQDKPKEFLNTPLELNQKELGNITAGTLEIGDKDTGTVTAGGDAPIAPAEVTNLGITAGSPGANMEITSDITMDGRVDLHVDRNEGTLMIGSGVTVTADDDKTDSIDGDGFENSSLVADRMVLEGTFNGGGRNRLTVRPDAGPGGDSGDRLTISDQQQGVRWLDGRFQNRVKVTVNDDDLNTSVSEFPVYVDLGVGELKNISPGNEEAIRVTKANGVTQLPREVVEVGASSGELHFRAENLDLSDEQSDEFYIYFNPEGSVGRPDPAYRGPNVWTNGFDMVQHMDDPADLVDSTANNRDEISRTGDGTGSGLTAGPEKVGGTVEFEGDDDFVTTSADYSNPGELTISTWLNFDEMPSGCCQNIVSSGAWAQFRALGFDNYNNIEWREDGATPHSTIDLSRLTADKWFHVTARFNGNETTTSTLLDGVLADQDESAGSTLGSASEQSIGGKPSQPDRVLDGRLDELRISKEARKDGWLKTQVANQKAPDDFFSLQETGDQLNLTAAEVDRLNAGTLQLGDGDTGAVTVDKAIDQSGDSASFSNLAVIAGSPSSNIRVNSDVMVKGGVDMHVARRGGSIHIAEGVTVEAGADSVMEADQLELNGTVNVNANASEDKKLTVNPYTDGQTVAVDTTSWFDSEPNDDVEWTNRVRVTVDGDQLDGTGDSGDLTKFPVYVDLSQMPSGFFEEVQSDGGDIRVVPAEGSNAGTAVPRELVGGSVDKASQEGELHFRAPSLSAGKDKTFYLYYGAIDTTTGEDPATPLTPRTTPTDVWMNGFDMVQHMDNPGDLIDSTANNRDETSRTGGGLRAGPEKVNGTVEFDGEDDFVTTSADYNDPSELTISTWLNFDDMPSGCCENIASSGAWAQFRTLVQPSNDINRIEWRADADPPHSTIDLSRLEPDKWFHVTARFNGNETTHSTLLNGVLADQDSSAGGTLGTATEQSIAGKPSQPDRVLDGRLDEMRISKVARSDGWLKTQVNNQNKPAQFLNTPLELNQKELGNITAGTLEVGNQDTGDVTFDGGTGNNAVDLDQVNSLTEARFAAGTNYTVRQTPGSSISFGGRARFDVRHGAAVAAGIPDAGTSDVLLNNSGNDFGTVGFDDFDNSDEAPVRNVELGDANGINLTRSDIDGTLTVNAAGSITDSAVDADPGTLTIDVAGNTTLTASKSISGGTDYADIQLGDTGDILDMSETAESTVEINGTLDVTGEDIDIDNDVATDLAGVDANAVDSSNSNDNEDGPIDSSVSGINSDLDLGNVTLTSSGSITNSGIVSVDGTATLDAKDTSGASNDYADIQLGMGSDVTILRSLSITDAEDVFVDHEVRTDLAGVTTHAGDETATGPISGNNGNFTLISQGRITDSADVSVDGDTILKAADTSGNTTNYYDIKLDRANGRFGDATADGDTLDVVGEDISIQDDTATTLAGVDANTDGSNSTVISANTGVFQLVSGGAIEDSTDLLVNGNASFDNTGAGAPITLGDSDDDKTEFGSLTVRSDGNVTVNEDSASQFASNLNGNDSDIGGDLALTSTGAITDQEATTVSVAGTATLDASNNDVLLDSSGNDFATVDVSGMPDVVNLRDANNLTLNELNSTGSLQVTADRVSLALTGDDADDAFSIGDGGASDTATFDADVRTPSTGMTINVDTGNGTGTDLWFNRRLSIGDTGGADQVGTLTLAGDTMLADAATLDVTLNEPEGAASTERDQLVVADGSRLQLGNPSTTTGPRITGKTGRIFQIGDLFRVIDNKGPVSTNTTSGQFALEVFQFGGQDFEVHIDDMVTNDANDVVMERVLRRFIWTEPDGGDWTNPNNWNRPGTPEEDTGVVFDTSVLEGGDGAVDVNVSSGDMLPDIEQIAFRNTGRGDNASGDSSYLLAGGGTIPMANLQIQEGLLSNDVSHRIATTLEMKDTTNGFGDHIIDTAGELVLDDVDGTEPVRLIGGDGGALTVNSSTVDVRLDTGAGNTLTGLTLNTTGSVDVLSALDAGSANVDVPQGTVRTRPGTTVTITAGQLTVGDRLEVGDVGNSFGDADGVGTLVVNGDLELTGGAVFETTLASNDRVNVNNGGVTLTNSPSMEIVTNTQFDETTSFTVLDNDGTSDAVSGPFADTSLTANSQEYLVNVNAGDGNDIVLDRTNTERVDPTSSSTDRGGSDEVTFTTQVNATGEDGLNETVTDELTDDEMDQLVTVLDDGTRDGDVPETAAETGREFLYGELGGSLGSRRYNQQLVARYSSRAEDLEAQLRLLEQTTNEATRDEETAERMQQLREAIDELRARAESAEQRLTEGDADEDDDVEAGVEMEEDPGLDQIPSVVQMDGQTDDVDGEPSVSAVDRHMLLPNQDLENLTAKQMRDQLRNDLQLGVFSDQLSRPLQAAVWTSLEQNPSVQAPNTSALREIAGVAATEAQQKGNEQLAVQLRNLQQDVTGWNSEDVMQFRTTAGGNTGWGSATVEVFLNRSTGDYLMTADVMINENADNQSKGTTFGEYAGEALQGYEGGFHTLTLTGKVESQ